VPVSFVTSATRPFHEARARYRRQILTMLSGDPHGEPDWVKKMSDGNDAGYFGPDSAVWHVNGAIPVIVAGVRALLMQTLHPGAMAGVYEHSRYNEDPLGRLAGTVRWVVTTTFGSTEAVAEETARVTRLHSRVNGTYQRTDSHEPGAEVPYSAQDNDLVAWVHCVFTDAFLAAHKTWGDAIPTQSKTESGEDRYVREWAIAGLQMGMTSPPTSAAELAAALQGFNPQLRADDRVRHALKFLTKPPLPPSTRLPYAILVGGAIATMDPHYRTMLGLKKPWWPAITLTRAVLWLTGAVLGSESTSRQRANERISRLQGY
jgi:uncharacterized protein (DUF2236 family)